MKNQKLELYDKITEYLALGGLVNPELMDHQKVRDLMMEIRDYLRIKPDEFTEVIDSSIEDEYEFSELIELEDWKESVKFGAFIPDDGDGYYVVDGKKTSVYVWEHPAPEGTTHVIWYNK